MTDTAQNYQKLLTEVLQKQIIILGPQITMTKVHNVQGLNVSDDGTVQSIAGDPKEVAIKVLEQFRELSPLLVKKTMQPLLSAIISSYPTSNPQPTEPEEQKPLEQVPADTAKPAEPEHHEEKH